ncbi:hypothetical protein NCLIV_024920 [Neospora caninum Liverpool]|uniref:Beige/BEACH domain-containing protein n=1 Tax=Neospora caninum (strain Liverpool) TaxID=572307 RepID=F0VG59_NEOCL|nr:hypothetical protein NCLIV_024920 [Neospora caninum Liverpool]CBZ52703.1 hypothetical protein NCLIV_024920 [Neospora caninum Liverpool]CEL66681.1 TPA: Beige/BEACH domain-containing protein [Neospora caninum Liverpool]|eukprot:XP_003882735.1 hypothetical protein NCLIV_024920 [Neospora caninum Liverpool]
MFTALRVFNLLVLEEGEEYLTDCPSSLSYSHPYAVRLSAVEATTCAPDSAGQDVSSRDLSFRQETLQRLLQQTLQHSPPERGRLRVCSKSLIFDSHHPSADIIKLPFKRILFLHPLPTPSHGAPGGFSSFGAPTGGRAAGGGGRPSEGRNSTTLLIGASEITRVPIQLFNGKTRCVRPFTSDCASSSPSPPEPDLQRVRSGDAGASLATPRPSSGSLSGGFPLANISSGAIASSLFSSGASTARTSWWPGSGTESAAGSPANVQPGANGSSVSQSPRVFLFLLTFESPRLSPLGSMSSAAYSAQSPSLGPRGGVPSLPALIDGLWRANNGKPLIPHIHRPRSVQRPVSDWGHGRAESAQSGKSGERSGTFGGGKAGLEGGSRDDNHGVIVDTEEYASEQLHALTQHLTFSLAELDHREQLLLPSNKGYWVRRIRPLIHHRGLLLLTSSAVYFQPHPNFTNSSTKAYPLQSLLHCFRRIQCLRPNALELVLYSGQDSPSSASFATSGFPSFASDVDSPGGTHTRRARQGQDFGDPSGSGDRDAAATADRWAGKGKTKRPFKLILLEFENEDEREIVARALQKQKPEAFLVQSSVHYVECMKQLWVNGRISTYHYLDFLNCIAGRSKSDYSAYPVFPWTIMRFLPTDTSVPLEDAAMRDLSKPVGALEPQRLQALLKRMKEIQVVDYAAARPVSDMPGGSFEESNGAFREDRKEDQNASSYLYGSHYSTPAFTVHWLVRLVPECQLRLHGGRFDSQQRMFNSMQSACKGALTGQSTFVELIPEFYEFDPSFLVNRLSVFLSPLPSSLPLFPSSPHILPRPTQQPPVALADVDLPPWPAHSTVLAHAPNSDADSAVSADDGPSSFGSHAETGAIRGDGEDGVRRLSLQRNSVQREGQRSELGPRGGERGDAASFLLHLRRALEGTWTSKHLHNWIDLIFGYKQTGEPARLAHNVFHPLTYANATAAAATGSCCPLGAQRPHLSPAVATTLHQLQPSALQVQLQEFGQTPIQLFGEPHPMRLACPPFDACAWSEACGHLTGDKGSAGVSPVSSPRSGHAFAPLAYASRSAASLSLPSSCSVRSTSMWGDMPWFVFMHHNRHLLQGLLDAPSVERSLSGPTLRLPHLVNHHRPSLPSTFSDEASLSRFLAKRGGASVLSLHTGAGSEDRGEPKTQRVHGVAENGEGEQNRSSDAYTQHGKVHAFPHNRGASFPVSAHLQRERPGASRDSEPCPQTPHVSAGGHAAAAPLYGREREAAVSASGLQKPASFPAVKPFGLGPASAVHSPWAVWLAGEKERRRVKLSKCPARASLTGLALWGETACCIGHDGSVMCFQLKDALCRGAREGEVEKSAEDGVRGPQAETTPTGDEGSEGRSGDQTDGRDDAQVGALGTEKLERESGDRRQEADGDRDHTQEEDEGRVDGGSLRSLAVYRLAAVPLCSATFVGSSGVIAVGAFDGSIALHGIHSPQVDDFGDSACEFEDVKTPARPFASTAVRGTASGSPAFAGLSPFSSRGSVTPSNLALSRPLSRQVCHADSVLALCYNPVLRLLISSSSDATVRVWDVSALASPCQQPSKSLLLLQVLDDHEGEVTAVASHRHLVLTGSEEGLMLLFDLRLPSQRSGAVWSAHTAGRAPIQSCEISDFSAAAVLDPAFLEDHPSCYAQRKATASASPQPGGLDGFEAVGGRSVYSPLAFLPSFGANCASLDSTRDNCVLLPSSYFPVQRWDFRHAGNPSGLAAASQRNGVLNGEVALGGDSGPAERMRGDGDGDTHALLQRRGGRPLCGCVDPAVQYALLAGVRRRVIEGDGEGDGAAGREKSRTPSGTSNERPGTQARGEERGGEGRDGATRKRKKSPFEGYLGLYDLRTRNEEATWALEHIEEPAFLATAPCGAELSVMGGGTAEFGATGRLMGCSYIAVGDLHGNLELLAAGDGIGKCTPWRG